MAKKLKDDKQWGLKQLDLDDIIEEFEWEQSMEHCGHCEFCRPIEEAGADVDDTARHPALNL